MMQRFIKLLTILIFACVVAACQNFAFPGVHKIPLQQGNVITQKMIDQLQPNMTKSQVRFILGTPLVTDSFHQNRWDYYYSIDDRIDPERRERISVYFEGDTLSRFTGDFVPSTTETTSASE